MGVGGVGQGATGAALAAAAGDNAAVGLTMLRRTLDVSQSTAGQLLASLPQPGQAVGGRLDVRL